MDATPVEPHDVQAFFAKWTGTANDGDWSAFGALLHPDVEMRDPMSPDVAHGAAAVLERAKAQYAAFPDGRTDVVGPPFVAVDGGRLAYQWRFVGTFTRPIDPPGFAPTGQPVRLDGVSLLGFAQGLVNRIDMVFDATDVARQIGAAPRQGGVLERLAVHAQRTRVRLRR